MMKDKGREVFKATPEEWEVVDRNFQSYLNDAVEFVNGASGKNLRVELKK